MGPCGGVLAPLGCLARAGHFKGLSTDPLCLVLHRDLTACQICEVCIFIKVPVLDPS